MLISVERVIANTTIDVIVSSTTVNGIVPFITSKLVATITAINEVVT